jgi:peptidyl-prolyl cis-trans isomerase C
MSIVRLRKVFRKRVRVKVGKKELNLPSWTEIVFGLIVLIFLVGAYYTFGTPSSGGGGDQQALMQAKGGAVIARVDGFKITRAVFDANVRMRMNGPMGEMDFTQQRYVKSGTLDALIEAALLREAARKANLKVTSQDISQKKEQTLDDVMTQKFPDRKRLRDYLQKKKISLDEYKAELRKELFQDPEALKEQLTQEKLQKQVEDAVNITDQDLKDSYTEVQASHILIDPKKEAEKAQAAEKGKAAPVDGDALAKQKAEQLLQQIRGGADFAKLAKENSADPGSGTKGGDLGWFKRGMMVKEFDDVAFKLKPGQVSDLVKTQFGYHIIKVVGQRSTLPKDFEKNKEALRTQFKDERKYKVWQEYRDGLKKAARIEVMDPELQAYRLQDEGKAEEAKQLLQQAVAADPANLSAAWELAGLLQQANATQEAVDLLDKLAVNETAVRVPRLHLQRGELYQKLNQKPKAIEAYKQALDWASAFTQQNMMVNMQLETKLSALGEKTLAAQAKAWLDDFNKQQQSQGGNPFGNLMVQ